jgi:uncharacterized damage-inducible protein DinB
MSLSSDPLDILLAHNLWATRRVLEACLPLSAEQFARPFDMGPGNLHDTLTHIIAAMRRWCDRLAGRTLRPAIDKPLRNVGAAGMVSQYKTRTPAELIALLEEAAKELDALVHGLGRPGARSLGDTVPVEFNGKVYTFTLGAGLVHVLTHGVHHRAQCLNMLRQIGVYAVKDLPELAVVDWQAEVETGQLAEWSPPAAV